MTVAPFFEKLAFSSEHATASLVAHKIFTFPALNLDLLGFSFFLSTHVSLHQNHFNFHFKIYWLIQKKSAAMRLEILKSFRALITKFKKI
jgi:hypothetical protein